MNNNSLDQDDSGAHRPPIERMTNEELESIAASTKNHERLKAESEGVKALVGFDTPSDTPLEDIMYYDSVVEKARILWEQLKKLYGPKAAYQISMHMAARSSAMTLYRGDSAQYLDEVSDRFERMAPPYLEELDLENDRLRRIIVCTDPDRIDCCKEACISCPFAKYPGMGRRAK